jgi:hypothetical protein
MWWWGGGRGYREVQLLLIPLSGNFLKRRDFQILSDNKHDVFPDLCRDLGLEYEGVNAAEGVVVCVLPAPRLRVDRIRLHGHIHVT